MSFKKKIIIPGIYAGYKIYHLLANTIVMVDRTKIVALLVICNLLNNPKKYDFGYDVVNVKEREDCQIETSIKSCMLHLIWLYIFLCKI